MNKKVEWTELQNNFKFQSKNDLQTDLLLWLSMISLEENALIHLIIKYLKLSIKGYTKCMYASNR